MIQPSNGSHLYLLRKRGHRLGWPTWPKVRFKSHAQNRWKFRFRTLSRRSIRFKPPTGSCKLSRDAYRFRTLSRRRVIRFRTHYRPRPTVRKKQQQLLRPTEMVPKDPLNNETSRVRVLNQSVSEAESSMHRLHTLPLKAPVQCGKPDASHMYVSDGVKDDTPYIQAVTLHFHQENANPCTNDKSKESLLRNNSGKEAIMHELSAAPQPTGAQYQVQSQVMGTSKSNEARGPINGQWPRSALSACAVNKGVNADTPPPGDKRSLARYAGEALKWRGRSHAIGRHAQWTGQYNGIRYLLQYVHWQTVRPQLAPISEWEERLVNERLAQIAQSVEHETLDPRVVGSSLHEKLQKLQMIISSNNSPVSLEYHDWPAIHCTLTPCAQTVVERNAPIRRDAVLSEGCGQPPCWPGPATNAFPEPARKLIADFHQHSSKECCPATPRKGMRVPRYNYAQRLRKFAGCMQSKQNLSVEWIADNNQQSLRLSNGNVESLCVVKEKSQRRVNSHLCVNQYDQTHDATPASADGRAPTAPTRGHARRALPVMSTCSTARQYGMSLSSPITAHPADMSLDAAAANTICSVSLLQNVGLNVLHTSIRARNSESMWQSYSHSFERRPKVCMARTKGSVQREEEREKDSDNDRPAERKVRPSKKGRKHQSPRPPVYVCYFCDKVNKQRMNHKRHLIMKYACRLDGTKARGRPGTSTCMGF